MQSLGHLTGDGRHRLAVGQLRGKHPDADVCTESACCQACLSEEQLRARLGDGFGAAWDKASAAVQATEGEVLTYDGALIEATYFSCSGGTTEAAAAVWGSDVPYLQSVSSPGEQEAAKYQSTEMLSPQAFAAAIRTLDEELVLKAAQECGKIITCEEHSVIGGLGEAVCALLSEKCPTLVRRIGVNDEFGHSGPAADLLKQFGLSAEHIVEVAKDFCGK